MFAEMIDEFSGLTAGELDEQIEQAELAIRGAAARLAAAAALVQARKTYLDDGHHHMRSYLKSTLNCSGVRANQIRRQAALLDQHPEVGDALGKGRIGVEQVDRLAKACTHPLAGERFAEFAPQLLEHAEQLEYRDFDRVVDHFQNMGDPDGSFDDQLFREDQRSACVSVVDASVEVHASGGDPLAAHEIGAVFDAAVAAELEKDFAERRRLHGGEAEGVELPRTLQQRKFDALHQIFLDSVAAPAGSASPPPLVNVLIDAVTAGDVLFEHGLTDTPDLLGIGDAALAARRADLLGRECSIDGASVHPDVALRAMVTGRVRRAVVDAQRVVIDLGRSSRLFTGKAREAAQLMVVSCTHRGCDVPAKFCDVDHRDEWSAHGGETNQSNAGPQCGSHDRHKHRAGLRVRRAVNGRDYLVRPTGDTILPVGAREPGWAEPCPITGTPPATAA